MSNPFLGIITDEFKQTFADMINAMLAEDGVTVPCQLIYPNTLWVKCPNCVINPVTGKSSGVYNGTGPIPFTKAPCPVCYGEGKKPDENTETIYMAIIWNYRKWLPTAIPIPTPEGYIQSICHINLLPKLKRADSIIVNTNISEHVKHRFIREGEPNPAGDCFQKDVFITTMWKRAG